MFDVTVIGAGVVGGMIAIELTKCAGIEMDRITGGAIVDANRETSVEGIFSCGNVLHVHDLVDFVSEESELAGASAAKFINGTKAKAGKKINVDARNGVRYTVPQMINSDEENVKIYFRVADIYKNVIIKVTDGENVMVVSLKWTLMGKKFFL